MGLKEYNRKRNFRSTPEPTGGGASAGALRYVIQKHAASHLHFDFRLELDGVLLSWAVPKGPSLDPGERRLAMRTEDHPMDYRDFEGVIPAGQYGGGTVMLWDRGWWEPDGDARRGMKQGKLEFTLLGERLQGSWRLVRTRETSGGKESWLLMKRSDDHARDESERRFVEEVVTSVDTGRTMEEIAGGRSRVWNSTEGEVEPTADGAGEGREPELAEVAAAAARTTGRRRRAAPLLRPKPMRPSAASSAPAGSGWLHETGLRGRRMLVRVDDGAVALLPVGGNSPADALQPVADAMAVAGLTALLDGVLTVLLPDGTSSADALEEALAGRGPGVPLFMAFDLLHVGTWDLRKAALEDRKALLRQLVQAAWGEEHPRVRYLDHVRGEGAAFAAMACAAGVGTVVSKRADGVYEKGSSAGWRRIPCAEGPAAEG